MPLSRAAPTSFVLFATFIFANAQTTRLNNSLSSFPPGTLLQIVRAEDERRWDDTLSSLLSSKEPAVRKRAALAAGRIGDERAVPALAKMLLMDKDPGVREMAAFALGETESAGGAYALVNVLKDPTSPPDPLSGSIGLVAARRTHRPLKHRRNTETIVLGLSNPQSSMP